MANLIRAARRASIVGALAVHGLVAGAVEAAPPEADGGATDVAGALEPGPPARLPTPDTGRRPTLKLLWFDPTRTLPARATDVAGEEVRRIFQGLGVEIDFAEAEPDATYGDGPTPEIPVILLRDDPVKERRASRVMGLVVRNQRPTRAVWAFLEPIRWTLGVSSLGRSLAVSRMEERGLGLALGRVVAHEVIHAIAPEEPHARNGLMSHSLDRAFLLGKRADLDGRCGQAFVSELAALRRTVPDDLPASAVASAR